MNWTSLLTLALLIVGGLIWAAASLGGPEADVAARAFRGDDSAGARALYVLVGLSALWQLMPFVRAWRLGEADAEADRRRAPAH